MRLLAAFFAAVLAIAAVTVASLRSLAVRRESSGWVTHTQDVRLSLERVLALATDAESTERAFLLTGRETYLQPFAAASAALDDEVARLRGLTADNSSQQQRVDSLARLLKTKGEGLRRAIERHRQGVEGSSSEMQSGEAGEVMEKVRDLVSHMSAEEAALLAERLEELSRADWWSAAVTFGGAALLLVLAAVASLMVRGDLLRRAQQAQERARVLEYQERLISIVGHDLRNPLTAVLVSAQMLLQKRDELRPGQTTAVERILRSASRIDTLVGLLIDFTHARLGKGIPTREGPMDASAVVERAVGGLREAYPGREIRVEAAAQALPGSWDGDRIAQLVSQLVTNALQYGSPGAPVIVSLAREADESLLLRVHNDGSAIPAELQAHLFEPYRRGKGAEISHPRGLGLGLFLVREIARAHGGTVAVRSGEREGTTFEVRLPKRPVPPPGGAGPEKAGAEVPVS
ncbi:MAG TPA: CHASE3 domain-containing protein [Myxococcales bacterium]|nr:CHASE3 domain-containing protein [Myxococcales bacterium]